MSDARLNCGCDGHSLGCLIGENEPVHAKVDGAMTITNGVLQGGDGGLHHRDPRA
jgi:hypothetical protein